MIIFLCISMVCGLDLNKLVKDQQAMLHTKSQISEPRGSEEEDF